MSIIDTVQYKNAFQAKPKTFKEQSSLGKDDFLRLLVTQLQNQDPTQPLQDREFIAQMTQFSTLEQTMLLNEMFSIFVESQQIGGLSMMIGKKVTWTEYVEETDANGQKTKKEIGKEGIVTAVSVKDGKPALVLQDGTKLEVNRVETITEQSKEPEKPTPQNEGGQR
jgi:flagellar basal-body rod modification protein FlgD